MSNIGETRMCISYNNCVKKLSLSLDTLSANSNNQYCDEKVN